MAMNINEIRQFFKIGGVFRAPEATEDGKKLTFNFADNVFDYTEDNVLESAVREDATNRVEFTLVDGTKVFLTLGALAWLDSVASAVTSVFGRSGVITAQSGDYNASQVTNAFNKAADDLDDLNNGTTNVHLTAVKLAEIQNAIDALHSHTNKAALDLITSAGGGIIPTALQIFTWDGWTGTTVELIQDTVATMLQNITGLTWTYDDTAGTLTPTTTLEAFTTDNLEQGTTNLYATNNTTTTVFTIKLPSAASVADRCSGVLEMPSGWTIAAGTQPLDLLVTHDLAREVADVKVWSVETSGKRLLTGNLNFHGAGSLAYSGLIAPNENSILVESLCTRLKPITLEFIFA